MCARFIDLLIRHGERVGVIGMNGSGKSVLLRLALVNETPDFLVKFSSVPAYGQPGMPRRRVT